MSVPVVESFSTASLSTKATSVSVTKPAGTQSGDYLVALVEVSDGTGDLPVTSPGFGSLLSGSPGSLRAIEVLAKVAGGSEPGSYTFSHGSSRDAVVLLRLSGVDTSNPINVLSSVGGGSSGSSITAASLTTTVANCLYLLCVGHGFTSSSVTYSATGSMAIAGQTNNGNTSTSQASCAIATESIPTAGATGTRSITASASGYHAYASIAIAGASGGGGSQTLTGTLFTNTNTFYGGTVQRGAVTLSGTLFTNTNSFYGATVGRGAVNISGALYSDADTFYAATLGKTYAITGSRFDNSAQFYAATVAPGTVTISGALFTDGDTFYAATVGRGAVNIAGSLYTDPDSFYAATVGQAGAPQNIDGVLFSNANAFYGSTVSASYTVSGTFYSDADSFYAATVSVSYAIAGSLYTDADTFFAASISQPNTPQTVTGQPYANDNQFFGGVVAGGASASATSSGGVGTTWARKTLSQIEREKKAALKRAKKRVVQIIEADPPQLGELLQIVREEVRQEAVEFPSTVVNDIISRLHMQMRAALIRRIEEEDEADAEFLLLVA